MKRALLLAIVLTLWANCSSRKDAQRDELASLRQHAQTTTENTKPTSADIKDEVSHETVKEEDVPPEFKGVDFKNFSYPTSFRKKSIHLNNGGYEYEYPDGGGETFAFADVDYVDLAGDGKKVAIVHLGRVSCGGSCDGGSDLFYVYTSRQNKSVLLWRIETGSLGYGCGLKSLSVNGRTLTLEVFKKCRFKGAVLESEDTEGASGKFSAEAFTRFTFESNSKSFALKKREISPYPHGDTKNYRSKITISDD